MLVCGVSDLAIYICGVTAGLGVFRVVHKVPNTRLESTEIDGRKSTRSPEVLDIVKMVSGKEVNLNWHPNQ
jgi:hypothetical protein